ncbi:MAG: PAS domain S-box protein [Candidatus Ozemobacteraceae bacterium]
MDDDAKTKDQLIRELEALRQRVSELERGFGRQAADTAPVSTEGRFRQLFRKIMEKMSEGLHLVRFDDLTLVYTNLKLEKMFGYSPGEMIGRLITIIYAPEDRTCVATKDAILEALRKTGEWSGEIQNIRKDGTTIWCYVNVSLFDHPDFGKVIVSIHMDITDRKQAEEALRESQELFSLFMHYSPIYTYIKEVTPTQSRVLQASDNFREMVGIPGFAMGGKTMDELFPPEFAAKITADDWTVVLNGEVLKTDEELNGRSYNTIKFPIVLEDKTLLAGYTIDVTERVRAEVSLRESEYRFRALFEQAAVGVAQIHSPTGRFVRINQKYCDIVGYSRQEMEQLDCLTITHPEDLVGDLANMELLKAGKIREFSMEKRYFRKDRSLVWVNLTVSPMWLPGESPSFHVAVVQDITEKKNATDALAAEKERLSVTLRCIGDGVIATDIKSNIVLMNKVAENLTGWQFEEAFGKPLTEIFRIVHELTGKPLENPVEKVLSTGQISELENHTLLISRDGMKRVIADSGAPIKDRNSVTIGVVLVFRDMTEKQRYFDAAQRTSKLESLGVLAGGIAHDFNNLMGGIFGYIDLARDISKDPMVSDFLGKAVNTIDRARGLTQQLLTFSKGGAPIKAIDCLFPLVKETAQFALSGSNVCCRFDIEENLWSCNFDKNQIGQVIDNLIINAQQAMPLGGTIELFARNINIGQTEHLRLKEGKYVEIAIKDYGTGIPNELLSRIFDPFFTTKTKGHGLGLAICYSIIHRHEGEINVESEMGIGSTFHIFLPASAESASGITITPDSHHKGSGTIIIMDDEESMRDTIGNMLKALGYTVIDKKNGRETIECLITETKSNRPITGFIFDLTIPGDMGGKAAVEEIRKLNSDVPVFVASGYADDPVMKNPTEYGFTASICKPFRKVELAEMLEKYMILRK